LRADFEIALARAEVAPLQSHVANLLTLEKKAVAAADWEIALAAREMRQKAEAELATLEKAELLLGAVANLTAPRPKVVFSAAEATTTGVRLDAAAGALRDWTPGGTATWRLPPLAPGGYEVLLRYSSSATQGGTIRVQEEFYSLRGDTHITLRGPEWHNLGTLRIRSGGVLTVQGLSVAKAGLMDLFSVELVPVGE
jgi:hypothetical protein